MPQRSYIRLCLTLSLIASSVNVSAAAGDGQPVSYVNQVRSILRQHCYKCHGADKHESGLRLNSVALAVRGGDRGSAIVPGNSSDSLLYLALIGKGEVTAMPFEAPRLPSAQIELIRRWIDEGARAPDESPAGGDRGADHWAFQPIRSVRPPKTSNPAWLHGAIDAFVQFRLEHENLSTSREATRSTLIRRLSLDLTGLLPALRDVRDFVTDDRPDAYDCTVDRLLASPHYGERWGRHWLDLARYADSNGYTIDGPRSIWKYRDWVIDAFNRDLPFSRFTIEQLAGDLLPDATRDQIIATGFHRNSLLNEEGGTDDEQYRVDSIYDRIGTTGTTWLGLTVGCAQCHSHKFDPISQREFYELFAIFNNCDEPTISVPTPGQATRQSLLKQQLAAAETPLTQHDVELLTQLPEWEERVASTEGTSDAWTVLQPGELSSEQGSVLAPRDDDSIYVDFSIPPNDTLVVGARAPGHLITAVRLEALTHASLPFKGPGRADDGNFVLSEFEMDIESGDQTEPVRFVKAVADHSQTGYDVSAAIDGDHGTGWSVDVKSGRLNVDREATFFPAEPVRTTPGTRLRFRLHHRHEVRNYLLGRFRLAATGAPTPRLSVPAAIRDIARLPPDKRTAEQQAQLENAFKSTDPARRPLSDLVGRLNREQESLERSIPATLVMRRRSKPRETHIHIRGSFLRKGERVQGAVPAIFHEMPRNVGEPDRLDFARWLFLPDNPLTARVTVNRYWQRFFGSGLVETENDFGTQGTGPTHPGLLDWLAREFERRKWSTKAIHRTVVSSATYRRSSETTPELLSRDPANKLLARQSRLRLEAEAIRDIALSASGLLSGHMDGPGVYPPQPDGLYIVTQLKKHWPESRGEARYRRAVYTYLWRSSLYPMFPTFDAPNANNCVSRRSRSNTPLQALTLANDRAFVELVQGLGRRILANAPDDDRGRLRYAFQVCLAREPGEQELETLQAFLDQQRASLSGSSRETETWNALARVVLNLDEFITRE